MCAHTIITLGHFNSSKQVLSCHLNRKAGKQGRILLHCLRAQIFFSSSLESKHSLNKPRLFQPLLNYKDRFSLSNRCIVSPLSRPGRKIPDTPKQTIESKGRKRVNSLSPFMLIKDTSKPNGGFFPAKHFKQIFQKKTCSCKFPPYLLFI